MLLPRDSVPEEELAAEAASKVKQSWFTYCSNEQCGNKRRESLLEYNNYFNVITYDVYPDTKAILWAIMAPRHSQPLPSSLMSITTRTLVQNSTKKKKEHPLSSPWYKHQKRQLALIHDYQLIFRMHSSFAKKSIKFKIAYLSYD